MGLGFIGTVAVALVVMRSLFAILAFGGFAYLGFQVAERLRSPKKTAGQFAHLFGFWMLVFLLPFAARMQRTSLMTSVVQVRLFRC